MRTTPGAGSIRRGLAVAAMAASSAWVALGAQGCVEPPALGALSCHFRCEANSQCEGAQICVDMGEGLGSRCCDPPAADTDIAPDTPPDVRPDVPEDPRCWVTPEGDDLPDCGLKDQGICPDPDTKTQPADCDPIGGWRDSFDGLTHEFLDHRSDQWGQGFDEDAVNFDLPRVLVDATARPRPENGSPARPALNFLANSSGSPRTRVVLPDAQGITRMTVLQSGGDFGVTFVTWHNPLLGQLSAAQGSPEHTYEVEFAFRPIAGTDLGELTNPGDSVVGTIVLESASDLALVQFDAPHVGVLDLEILHRPAGFEGVLVSYDDGGDRMAMFADRDSSDGETLALDRDDFPVRSEDFGKHTPFWAGVWMKETTQGPVNLTFRASLPPATSETPRR